MSSMIRKIRRSATSPGPKLKWSEPVVKCGLCGRLRRKDRTKKLTHYVQCAPRCP